MMARKVLIALGAAAAAGFALFLWMRGVAAKVGTQMVVTTAPPSSVAAGAAFTFAGRLEDDSGNRLAGKTVNLRVDGATAGSVTTDANGMWSWSVALDSSAVLYAEFQGDEEYAGCGRNA